MLWGRENNTSIPINWSILKYTSICGHTHHSFRYHTLSDAPLNGLLYNSTLNHDAFLSLCGNPLLWSQLKNRWQIPEKRWNNRHIYVAYITVCFDKALLPAAEGTMVQHQTDSSMDNVTLSVQSCCYNEAGRRRRAQLPGQPAHASSLCAVVCAGCCQPRWAS